MTKKRKKRRLDQFMRAHSRSKASILNERTRLSNRVFRAAVSIAGWLALLFLVPLPDARARLGLALILVLVAGLGMLVAQRLAPHAFDRVSSFNQFIGLLLGTVLISKLMLVLGWSPFFLPVPILAMVLSMAYSPLIALVASWGLAAYLALLVPHAALDSVSRVGVLDLEVAVVLGLGATTAALGVDRVRTQSRPVIVGLWVGLVQAAAIVGFIVFSGTLSFADLSRLARGAFWEEAAVLDLARKPGMGFAGGLIAGGVVTSILPLIERAFGVVTERRLIELADPSNPLLRVLRERAPGTFQHTLGVQQLARDAAAAIGADVLLTDVGAYYHDIGKIHKPEYFVENMGEDRSIHDRLRPSMSKLIIISHVKDGVLLAREEKLPTQVVDMIPMHHGTTVVEFFFRKALRESDPSEQSSTEDVEYRYPGPRPTFPEAGILMLADACEAIAKTIEEPTPQRFRAMVKSVIERRLKDHQLDECRLTLSDLHRIEESFVRTLSNMYHSRIKYPAGDRVNASSSAERWKPEGRAGADALAEASSEDAPGSSKSDAGARLTAQTAPSK